MNLRDAAERTSRSVTTLRRYIRSGRLRAEKSHGRYGPEYMVSEDALEAAGLHPEPIERPLPVPTGGSHAGPLEQFLRESVPASLYHELQMKHEQLLVQYGMVRMGGLRVIELQADLEAHRRRLAERESEIGALRERASRESAALGKRLREAELELEGRNLEVAALQEKVRALERIARHGEERESIERQFSQVMDQIRRVERLGSATRPSPSLGGWPRSSGEDPDH